MSNPNPFEELAELEDKQDDSIKAPPHLRHKILGTYHLVTGVFKVLEIFLSNAVNTALNMVSLVSEEGKDKPITPPSTSILVHALQVVPETQAQSEQQNLSKDQSTIQETKPVDEESKPTPDLSITSPLFIKSNSSSLDESKDVTPPQTIDKQHKERKNKHRK